jgi:hypothetical protein
MIDVLWFAAAAAIAALAWALGHDQGRAAERQHIAEALREAAYLLGRLAGEGDD